MLLLVLCFDSRTLNEHSLYIRTVKPVSLYVDFKKKCENFYLDVSFEAGSDVLGLLGASGSGKSTILKCIAGTDIPDEGKIILNDETLFDSTRRIKLPPKKRKVGYLFQNYALLPSMNVRQNILSGVHDKKDKAEKESAVDEISDILKLSELENNLPHELSKHQQQKVALARILAGNPDILLLDEPLSALDTHLRGQLQVDIQKLIKHFGKSALIATHSRDEAYSLCNRIALVEDGRILALKDTKALFSNPESRHAALLTGCKNVIDARKTGERELTIPAWGVKLTTALPLRDGLCAIAIRAHYFNAKTSHNRYPVHFVGRMEEPFEYILQFRYESQDASSPDIWWRLPKDKIGDSEPRELGIAPQNVLPLYE